MEEPNKFNFKDWEGAISIPPGFVQVSKIENLIKELGKIGVNEDPENGLSDYVDREEIIQKLREIIR